MIVLKGVGIISPPAPAWQVDEGPIDSGTMGADGVTGVT